MIDIDILAAPLSAADLQTLRERIAMVPGRVGAVHVWAASTSTTFAGVVADGKLVAWQMGWAPDSESGRLMAIAHFEAVVGAAMAHTEAAAAAAFPGTAGKEH